MYKIEIEISFGELCDRITILNIKKSKIIDVEKLAKVDYELSLSQPIFDNGIKTIDGHKLSQFNELYISLKHINVDLWDVEDKLREQEKIKCFGPEFIALARSVYRLNDKRSITKSIINELIGSKLTEVKSYK